MKKAGTTNAVKNIAQFPWHEMPGHFRGALSKMLVRPESDHSHHFDFRISAYQPMGHVERHAHKAQEQIYYVLKGEALLELDEETHVMREHDFVFIAPGRQHSIANTGLSDLIFFVITSPPDDEQPV